MGTQQIRSDFLALQPNKHKQCILIVLNHTLPKATLKLWNQASFKICADGGSNRLYDSLPFMMGISEDKAGQLRREFIPNLICGDLDSIRKDVRDFYETDCQVPVLDLSHDQDSTDLAKCLSYINHKEFRIPGMDNSSSKILSSSLSSSPSNNEEEILVLGAMGGRLDHTISNLNALYQFRHLNITLWGEGNLVRLIRRGSCMIYPLRSVEGPSCGLAPLSGPATASSSGLKWNLDKTILEFGGLISTCNIMEGSEIMVNTDNDLLWMTTVSENIGYEIS